MTWAVVQSKIDFAASSWNLEPGDLPVSSMTLSQQSEVITALQDLYTRSAFAQTMLDTLATGDQKIRIGVSSSGSFYQFTSAGYDDFFSLSKSQVDTTTFVSTNGVVVSDNFEMAIAHELAHKYYGTVDPVYDTGLTSSTFDYIGNQVRAENTVAIQLGLDSNQRSSYWAFGTTTYNGYAVISTGESYTNGNHIDFTIFGYDTKSDLINISSRSGAPSTLLMGFGGSDSINGAGGIDYIYGGNGDDTLRGGLGADSLSGGDGNDQIYGDDGNDTLQGGLGGDLIQGNMGGDLIHGGQGHDTVIGGQGSDNIFGELGNDSLNGALGDDSMAGGGGADTFLAQFGNGVDVITDFNRAEGDAVRLVAEAHSISQVGANVIIYLGNGDSVTVLNTNLASLDSGWLV